MRLSFHDILKDIFICITVHWSSQRMPVLELVLHTIKDYPTNTTVCLITNERERLSISLKRWNFDNVMLCGPNRTREHAFQLAWEHREVMEAALAIGHHSLFMYMEDDLGLSWPALEAWAYDENLLVPMGLHRGFVRVQPAQWDGSLIAQDQLDTVSLSSGNATISIPHTTKHSRKGATTHFVHVAGPYMAMWLASRPQLEAWQKEPEWEAERNGYHDNPSREYAAHNLYGMREDHFIKQSGLTGFRDTLVVPYDPDTRKVLPIATVTHLDTKETSCSSETRIPPGSTHCSVPFDEMLVD